MFEEYEFYRKFTLHFLFFSDRSRILLFGKNESGSQNVRKSETFILRMQSKGRSISQEEKDSRTQILPEGRRVCIQKQQKRDHNPDILGTS